MTAETEIATLRKFSAIQVAELLKAQQQIERLQNALTAAEAVNQERAQVIAEQAAEIERLKSDWKVSNDTGVALLSALQNLLIHVELIEVTEGFEVEVLKDDDSEYGSPDIHGAMQQARKAMGLETEREE